MCYLLLTPSFHLFFVRHRNNGAGICYLLLLLFFHLFFIRHRNNGANTYPFLSTLSKLQALFFNFHLSAQIMLQIS